MLKKIITAVVIAASFLTVIYSCEEDNSKPTTEVGYASQNTSTGSNPNPNSPTSTGAVVTTTATPPPATAGSITVDTYNSSVVSATCGTVSGTYQIKGTSSGNYIDVRFSTTPVAGSYTIIPSGALNSSNCKVTGFDGNDTHIGQSGTVVVTLVSGKIKITFSAIPAINSTTSAVTALSANITCP